MTFAQDDSDLTRVGYITLLEKFYLLLSRMSHLCKVLNKDFIMSQDHPLPEILSESIVAQTRLFTVQAQQLRFQNGVEVVYERMMSSATGAVLILPMLDSETLLLIKEYACGMRHYELGFPKGKIDPGEVWAEAAVRETMEEVGYRPQEVSLLDKVSLAAGYMTHQTHLVLAEGLVPAQAEGDEPEPLEVIPWKLDDWQALIAHPHFTEGRAYAALLRLLQEKKRIG